MPTTAEAVAAVPGGAALAEVIGQLETTQPEVITGAAQQFRSGQEGAGQSLGDLGRAVSGLDGAWEGSSADAFVGYMDDFSRAGTQASQAMGQVAEALTAAATALQEAKAALVSLGENFIAEANRLRSQRQGMPAGDMEAALTAMAGEYEGQARPHIDAASQALNQAADAIAVATGSIGGFSAMPEPGTQSFTPAPGRPVDWTPSIAGQDGAAATAPQGAGGANSSGGYSGYSGGGYSGDSGGGYSGGGVGGGYSDGGGFSVGGGLGPSGGPPAGPPPGNVDQWIREAIRILQENGYPVTEENIRQIWTIIQHESGGDPNAINTWDSNAAKGTPSKGLMQTIDPTFDAHALPGHTDIWNPVDNIVAGVAYTFDRYGSLENHPGLASIASGGGYQPY